MTEEKAREIAISIIDIFEDLLGDKGIYLPSEDREGEEDEACIYGDLYYDLEDEYTKFILDSFPELCTDDSFLDLADEMIASFNEILKDFDLEISEGDREDDNDFIGMSIHGYLVGQITKKLTNALYPTTNKTNSLKNVDNCRICKSIVIPFDKFCEDIKKATKDESAEVWIDVDGICINTTDNYYNCLAEYYGVKEVTGIHADDDILSVNIWVSFTN